VLLAAGGVLLGTKYLVSMLALLARAARWRACRHHSAVAQQHTWIMPKLNPDLHNSQPPA